MFKFVINSFRRHPIKFAVGATIDACGLVALVGLAFGLI
jgi:hypothetical protein